MIPNVPVHKLVKFFQGTTEVFPGVDFIYDDELSLNISSTYDDLLPSFKSSNLLTLVSNSFKVAEHDLPSGQFALQGFQIWQRTAPLEFNLNLLLYMKESGIKDVVIPALKLSKMTVPGIEKTGIPGAKGLIPPGPTIKDILTLAGITGTNRDTLESFLGAIKVSSNDTTGLIRVEIGSFYSFENCIITRVVPTFSEAKDEDFAPISCSLSLDFRTSEVVTNDMIDSWIPAIKASGGLK